MKIHFYEIKIIFNAEAIFKHFKIQMHSLLMKAFIIHLLSSELILN